MPAEIGRTQMHKDDAGKRPHCQTIHLGLTDAPGPDEVVITLGTAVGGHPDHRFGDRYADPEEMGRDAHNLAGV